MRMQHFRKPILAASLFIIVSVVCYAQTGDIRGFVYEKANGEPIVGANVYLEGTTFGSTTDINGFFSIAKMAPGDYNLTCTYLGYDTVKISISLEAGRIITRKIYVEESSILLKVFEMSAERQERQKLVGISTHKIKPKQIQRLPSIGGEPDLAQYLQIIPGVIVTGDQGGQLYIRGGAPIHNKVLLDGMTIYNPFHSIGLFSVFETDIIRNVDVITGGFNAEHGDRISAVVDITTRDGNKKRFAGKVSAGPFLSKAIVEGPILKLKEDGRSVSFIFASKYSYLDKTSPILYSYVDSGGLPYSFNDYYGKISFNAANGSKWNIFGFNFRDRVNYQFTNDLNWKTFGFGTDFVIVPLQSTTLISGDFSFSDYLITSKEADEKPRTSQVNGFNLGLNFTYFVTDGEIKYGFEILGFKTDFNFFNPLGIKIEQIQYTTELGGFFKFRKKIGKVVIEPSFRTQYYASLPAFSPEPRFGIKYNMAPSFRLKFAGGWYSQNLISAVSDRDVVNLFTGFLSGPEQTLTDTKGDTSSHKLQKAIHAIGGLEYDVSKRIEVNFEVYEKIFTQVLNINRFKLLASDPDFMIETGKAYGVDFLLKYDYKRLYVWAVYSLGYVTRFDGDQTYSPHFNRRHNVNLLASYTFGKDLSWEASARWNLGSGFPFTLTQGFYEKLDFDDGINTNYTTESGQLGIIYDENRNAGRLPFYHRLDLSIKRDFVLADNMNLQAVASVTNIYNRNNIFYFDRIRYERVDQLPILPALGVNLTF